MITKNVNVYITQVVSSKQRDQLCQIQTKTRITTIINKHANKEYYYYRKFIESAHDECDELLKSTPFSLASAITVF